ncbi:MAG: type-F conjugative transfer system pilin assembly protein TrbC [Rickettsiaceae bacterium]|nr:type-F conjugative transfer system pilin assembly protein TrbC [Rickettsiaceae bacterium]
MKDLTINIVHQRVGRIFVFLTLSVSFVASYANIDNRLNNNTNNAMYKEIDSIKQQALDNAAQYTSEAKEIALNSDDLAKHSDINKEQFLAAQKKMLAKAYKDAAGSAKNNGNKDANNKEKILVFVSFSMPEPALTQLLVESTQYNAVLLIQGLIDNSLPKTLSRISKLVTDADNKGGLEISPNLFEQYNIKKVPAYVINFNSDVVNNSIDASYDADAVVNFDTNKNAHVVYGVSGIKQAVDVFSNKNLITKATANRILNNA